ncbi:hypothetical protein, partial [Kineococcus arenarius]|uniref:hypothetical protein n=1 Tax=unclassified Kineococcus TaxID=2621656 RepID=UPI003D7DF84F
EDDEIVEAGRIYQLFGFAGADVDGVDIVLSNGTSITATVEHGLWGAWWPASEGEPDASQLTVHTGTGDRTIVTSEAAPVLPT